MSALEKVLLSAGAGTSAGTTAGKSAGSPKAAVAVAARHAASSAATAAKKPDAHEKHEEHLRHLHRLHVEHVEHVEHEEHEEEEEGEGTSAKPRKAKVLKSKTAKVKAATGAAAAAHKEVGKASAPVKTPGPVGLTAVLRLAAADEEDASTHLHGACPWFRSVNAGDNAADFKQYCKPAKGEEVKLTPRTAEASTVPEPTVPPGGPGLFHIKGRGLPPYIQHLWHHLAPKYGKQRAYGMAVGIVKKWAAGVNPGGWNTKSGKGKRTHADVRAAAQKNVAQWEKDKADAHKQSASHGHG